MSNPQSDPTMSVLTSPAVPTSPLPPPGSTVAEAPPGSEKAMNFASTTALIAAPILLLMPPRKLDLYTLSLCGLWVVSADHQVRNRTGQGLMQWAAARRSPSSEKVAMSAAPASTMPQRAQQARLVDELWREELRGRRRDPWAERGAIVGFDGRVRVRQLEMLEGVRGGNQADGKLASRVAGLRADSDTSDGGVKGLARDVWYGNEDPRNWKEKRMAEERQAAAEGKSVGDRILSQVWTVWNEVHTEEEKAKEHLRLMEEREKERQLAETKEAERKE